MNREKLYQLITCVLFALLLLTGCAPSSTNEFPILQEGNNLSKTRFLPNHSEELADNRIGFVASNLTPEHTPQLSELASLGIKRIRWTVNEGEATIRNGVLEIDWHKDEFFSQYDSGIADEFADDLVDNGIISTYMLTFWDKANHTEGWGPEDWPSSRFKTEEEIQRYLDYVRFVVRHFKDRIQYYELWNEPDMGAPIQQIAVEDYINLVERTVPVIHQEDPEAKIVVGGLCIYIPSSREYLFSLIRSDVISMVDVISWHPMHGASPEHLGEYYSEYPSLVQEIKDIAYAHGFRGEYVGEEICWRSLDNSSMPRSQHLYSNTVTAKYYARGIVMHLGMDLTTGTAGLSSLRVESFTAVSNLCTLMAGAKPSSVTMEVESAAINIKAYSFSLPDGSQLISLWTDGVAVDEDPGIEATVTIHNVSVKKVTGIDVLNGFEQPLKINIDGTTLVILGLLIKDYPLFLRLIP